MIDTKILEYLDRIQPLFDGPLGELQREAINMRYPIIRPEAARFLCSLLALKRPEQVLEIGCAVGFSAGLFSKFVKPEGKVTTIERYPLMIQKAKESFKYMGIIDKVLLLEGDALEILPALNGEYDFIFLDAAKGQYLNFLPHCLRLLKKDGILVADDVLQGGTVAWPRDQIAKRQKTTHRRMRCFLWLISNTMGLESSIVPIGDGMAVCIKTEENVVLPEISEEDF